MGLLESRSPIKIKSLPLIAFDDQQFQSTTNAAPQVPVIHLNDAWKGINSLNSSGAFRSSSVYLQTLEENVSRVSAWYEINKHRFTANSSVVSGDVCAEGESVCGELCFT